MRRLGNRGTGFIGISLILILMLFFYSGFYVSLELLHSNVLNQFIELPTTQDYYDTYLRPMWLSFSIFFLFSIIIWGVVQTQSTFNMASIAGVWIVILFGFTVLTGVVLSFDKWIMQDLPTMLPMDQVMVSFYENLVKPLWRTAPIAIYCMFVFFGVYMASTYAEKGGQTFIGAYSGGRR